MIKVVERFSNGSLEEFNPAELMRKVQSGGYSLHTVRMYGDDEYTIYIDYSAMFRGTTGAEDDTLLYNVEIIKEDANGNQDRVLSKRKLTSKEAVKLLNAWKSEIIGKEF